MASSATDAVDLLIQDHEEVTGMFEQFEALSDRSGAKKKALADKICEALNIHTLIEEEIFYPAVGPAIEDPDMIDEAVVEHAAAKDLILQIQEMEPDDDLYDAKVKVLSEQITHHVNEEQDDMFPKVRKTDLDLAALGAKMVKRKSELEAAGV